jgi:propanol-preferring alcohol dehydrogenase
MMQAQVLHAWGDALAYEKVPTPTPGRGEVLIRVEACGVGLTVLNYMNGSMDRRPELLPRVPGHEFVGTVAEVGAEVHAPRVGQRVMAYFYLACGHCDYCRLAHEPLCRNLRGNVGVVTNGGYAEYAVLPAFNCLPVPDRLSTIEATAVIDAIATPLHVNRRAGIGPTVAWASTWCRCRVSSARRWSRSTWTPPSSPPCAISARPPPSTSGRPTRARRCGRWPRRA